MPLIDSHAHLTDPRLRPNAEELVARARAAGVERVITIGTDAADSREAAALADRLPGIFATAGIHPHAAGGAGEEAFAAVAEIAAGSRVVAVGETGLDYHYDNSPRDAQRNSFLRHLELGRSLGLPVVVHSRSADDDLQAILRETGGGTRGVLHCFTGGRALLDAALDLGWYISFSGLITFPKYADAELLRTVPPDRILVETDSPYLAPVPLRGKDNEPANVTWVAARAAALRGEDPESFALATADNARAFYALPE